MDTPVMQKTLIGVNPDGTQRYHYVFNGPEGGGVLRTGPVSGTVVLKDGTAYSLEDDFIAHHPGHGGALAHHIALIHEQSGRLGPDFRHVCTDECGDEGIPERRSAPAG